MNFLNPNGLWFLLGIPLLIFLYILKQKYAERAIASSFIWRKSEHLIKKNIRWQKLLKYLLFILQLLIVVLISLVIARPVLNPDSTGVKYVVIVDGSASMLAESNGQSRFDRAVGEISDIAYNMPYGSTMTVILAGDNAECVIKSADSESAIHKVLSALECTQSDADVAQAITLAKLESAGAANAEILFYTDRDYEETGDINTVNMSNGEWNAAVINLSAENGNGGTVFLSTVASYGADAKLALALYIDGKLADAKIAECVDGVPLDIYWDCPDTGSFSQVEVSFDTDDSISSDNRYVLCGGSDSSKDVLIVSDSPFFLQKALASVGDYTITTAKSLDTIPSGDEEDESEDSETADDNTISGYDLYIFDGVTPDTLPEDGAVWLINPDTAPDGTGLKLGDTGTGSTLTATGNNSSETYAALTQYLEVNDIVVSEYTALLSYGDFEPLLECGNSPVLLAKQDDDYVKTVVLMFDIHDSNLPLLVDFPLLIYNMAEYSLPSVLDDRDYTVNEAVHINALPDCHSIRVENTDDGTKQDVSLAASSGIFTPVESGVYNVKQIVSGGGSVSVVEDTLFVHIDVSESNIYAKGGSLGLGEATAETTGDADSSFLTRLLSGKIKLWPYLAMLLLLILLTEWRLYYREQF